MSDTVLYKDDKYEVKLDEKYGYYHIFPIPSAAQLTEYYANEFYSKNYNKQINDSSCDVQKEEMDFINMQYADIVETLKKEASGQKLIDIGCGFGNFLKYCQKHGFDCVGIDPAQNAVEIAQKEGVNIIRADIENFTNLIKSKYHSVVMLNVLEHLRQPYEILKNIRDYVLEDGGVLVIRVPNEFNKLQMIANEEYNLKKWWVAAPQHINYFTIQHLEGLITNCGYEVFLKESTFPLEMFILFGDQYVGNPQVGKTIHNKRVLFEKTLKNYDNAYKRLLFQTFAKIGIGREITIYARKK